MHCAKFRDTYSDYADGLLDEAAEIACRRHLSDCADCRRLDAAFRAGTGALRRLPALSPSAGFRLRLLSRLAGECAGPMPALRPWSGIAGAVLVCTVVGVAAVDFEWGEVGEEGMAASAFPGSGPVPTRRTTNRFAVRLPGDTSLDYPSHFPLVPVSADPFRSAVSPATSFEVTVDWIVP